METGNNYLRLSTIGIELVVATLIGYAIGWFLDEKAFDKQYAPWFTIAFLIIGFAAGIRNMIQAVRSVEDNDR